MKPLCLSRLALVVCFIALAETPSLRAEFIQPVAVQASNGQGTQDALINGQGFDDPGIGSGEVDGRPPRGRAHALRDAVV